MARLPLAVAVDDEGGRVQRIDELDGQLPSARAMSRLDPLRVRELGRDRARELAGYGITMNFAPTVDVGRQRSRRGDRRPVLRRRPGPGRPATPARSRRASARPGCSPCSSTSPGTGTPTATRTAAGSARRRWTSCARDDLRPYAELVGPGGPLAGAGAAPGPG